MNPRRVHKLMRQSFPSVDLLAHEWTNVAESSGPKIDVIKALLEEYIASAEVIVEVHRTVGALLPRDEAIRFVGEHIGEGRIRIANREFTSFFVVLENGVAAGWRRSAAEPDAMGKVNELAVPSHLMSTGT